MPNSKSVCILPGDGIGAEVTKPAVELLHQVASLAGFEIKTHEAAIGVAALQ